MINWDFVNGVGDHIATLEKVNSAMNDELTRLRVEVERYKKWYSEAMSDREGFRAEVERLRAAAKDLITVVRMPNVEHIADAHNAAVRALKGETE